MTTIRTFREFEHSGWQEVAGSYHDHFSALTSQTIKALIKTIAPEAGFKVLDIATGPGYVASELLKCGCHVTGLDFAKVMIERARSLYEGIEFIEGDAQALPFADQSFDCATMNFGILHLDEPQKALRQARRVLVPGGRLAFSLWCQPSKSIAFQIVLSAIDKHGNNRIPLPEGPAFFRFSDQDLSRQSLLSAGFVDISIEQIDMTWRVESGSDLFEAFFTGTPRTGGLLRAQDQTDLEAIRASVIEQCHQYKNKDAIEIPMASLIVSGRRPLETEKQA
ncbi:MAG: methyltransferase domain-containing protein [Candidatus Obscuribacterales bacterium]|nr:methyltransferase domain-containing protein [Candidatus Obscuribacterales bacterium]